MRLRLKVLWWVLRGRPVMFRLHLVNGVITSRNSLIAEVAIEGGDAEGYGLRFRI